MERFCFYSIRAILVIYLTAGLGLSAAEAVTGYSLYNAACYLSPLLGAYVADVHLGRPHTIAVANVIYLVGSTTLAATAFSPSLTGAIVGLSIMAVATGGIKACVAPLGAEQLAGASDATSRAYFGAFYWAINLGSAVSYVATPLIRAHAGYGWAFATATLAQAVAAIAFMLPAYITMPAGAGGSPCAKFSRVIGAACCRSRWQAAAGSAVAEPAKGSDGSSSGGSSDDSSSGDGGGQQQQHRRRRAQWCAWVASARYPGGASARDVADVGVLLRVTALLAPMPVFWALFDAQGSVWTLQRVAMDNCLGSLCLTPEQAGALNPLLVMLFVPLFESAVLPALSSAARSRTLCRCNRSPAWPCVRRRAGPPSATTAAAAEPEDDAAVAAAACCFPTRLRRMGAGMQLAAVAFVATALVQAGIDASRPGTVSVAWQLPQFVLITAAEVLVCTTGLEFAYHSAPPTLRSTALAFYYVNMAVGNLLTGFVYGALSTRLSPAAINWLFAAAMCAAGIVFAVLAWYFPPLRRRAATTALPPHDVGGDAPGGGGSQTPDPVAATAALAVGDAATARPAANLAK